MRIFKISKLAVILIVVSMVVRCTPWTKPKAPDFGEEGSYCPSEKVECFLGGNAHGLSNEAYLARADKAWELGVEVMVTFEGELFREAPLEGLSEAENELLLGIREEVEALESISGNEPGQIVLDAYSEFLGLEDWLQEWGGNARLPEPYMIACLEKASELDLEWMTELAESPLIQKIKVSATPRAVPD